MYEYFLPGALENVTFENMDVTMDGKVVGKVIDASSNRRGIELRVEITDPAAYTKLLFGRAAI